MQTTLAMPWLALALCFVASVQGHRQLRANSTEQGPFMDMMRSAFGFSSSSSTRSGCWALAADAEGADLLDATACDASLTVQGSQAKFDKAKLDVDSESCGLAATALGGSISTGMVLRVLPKKTGPKACKDQPAPKQCKQEAWPALLAQALNQKYPCKNGAKHTVENIAMLGRCTSSWITFFMSAQAAISKSDLVIVETASNDVAELHGFPPVKSNFTSHGHIQAWTDLLSDKLLQVPNHPALAWLEAGWRSPGPPALGASGAEGHREVLEAKGITQVSLLSAISKIWEREQKAGVKDDELTDLLLDGIHPGAIGHGMLASLMLHNIDSMTK